MEQYTIDYTLTFEHSRKYPDEARRYFVVDNNNFAAPVIKSFTNIKEAKSFCKMLNISGEGWATGKEGWSDSY